VYNDEAARSIIDKHCPQLLPVYNSYSHVVQKGDLLRLLLVYLFGGFYMDFDVFCLKNLEGLRNLPVVLAEEKMLTDMEADAVGLKQNLQLANYMFGSIPRHPFWLAVIKEVIKRSTRKIYTESDILETTGPWLLSNVYATVKHKYPQIVILRNTDRVCMGTGHADIACHFGNFGAHLHHGTWRWGGRFRIENNDQIPGKKQLTTAQRFVDSMMANTGFNGKLALLKQNRKSLDGLESFKSMYETVSGQLRTVSDPKGLNDHALLTIGDFVNHAGKLTRDTINILYTMSHGPWLTGDWVGAINNHYDYCLVPHPHIKELFVNAGVICPIDVLPIGFRRFNRRFGDENETQKDGYVIGLPVTNDTAHLASIVAVCKKIKEERIPGLTLKLLLTGKASFTESWIEITPADEADLSNWFNSLHCFITLNGNDRWSFGPAESLYMGISTIISNDPLYDDFARTGFLKVIGTDLEPGILDVYNNYAHYNKLAIKGAAWIEDTWRMEAMAANIQLYVEERLIKKTQV
jgi:hypothetical protein